MLRKRAAGEAGTSSVSRDRGGRRRLGPGEPIWNLASQALNGASSFLLSIVVARSASTEVFGQFTLTLITYVVLTGCLRASLGQALVIERSGHRADARSPLIASAVAGLMTGLVALCIAIAVGAGPALGMVVLLALPAAALHDCVRYLHLATDRPRGAAALDGSWLGLEVVGFGACVSLGRTSPASLTAVWAATALVAAGPSLVARFVPAAPGAHTLTWLRDRREMLLPLLYEGILLTTVGALALAGVAVFGGMEDVGALRAGQVALAPMTTFVLALQVSGLASISRTQTAPDLARRAAVRIARWAGAGCALWVGALLLLPDRLGEELLGEVWEPAQRVLPYQGLALIISAVVAIEFAYLKVMASAREAWRVRARVNWIDPVLASVGARVDGAVGASRAQAGTQLVILVALFSSVAHRTQRTNAQSKPGDDAA